MTTSPTRVTLTFGEDVGVGAHDIAVYDDQLHRVDAGSAGHVTGQPDVVGVGLRPDLHRGTYTVTWRVTSADSHPVAGGFTFSVGAPSHVSGTVSGLGGGSRLVGLLLGGSRLLGYLGLVLGPGVLAFLLLWPAGRSAVRMWRTVVDGVGASVVAAVGGFLLQGPYALGRPLSATLDTDGLSAVATSRYGHALIARLVLLVALAALLPSVWRGRRPAVAAAIVAGVGLSLSWALAGHSGTGRDPALSVLAQAIHVAAMAVWMGGLVVIVGLLLRPLHRQSARPVLTRFSTVAFWSITAIVVTGAYQSWRQVGLSWTALTTTTYGRLLAVKILGILGILVLGWFARSVVHSRAATEPDGSLGTHQRLRAGIFAELAAGIGILVVTSILVNTVPAKEAVSAAVHRTLHAGSLTLRVAVVPGRRGPARISVAALRAASPARLVGVTGTLSLPSKHVSGLPLVFTVSRSSGRASAVTTFPGSGNWRLALSVQTSRITATDFALTFPVR